MKILTVVGARPQFIKAAPVARALQHAGCNEIIVHTGQHYDQNMSDLFFEELEIPAPAYNLGVGSASHGAQTGAMLAKLEELLLQHRPQWVLVYGDTNSTIAGALAAAKLRIKVAHVEARLRSFRRAMPEEINRIVTDHVSDLLFCPSETASKNLAAEGITRGVHVVGDVMAEALAFGAERSKEKSRALERLNLSPGHYLLATLHRAENTDNETRLKNILRALSQSSEPIVLPLHPRTRKKIEDLDGVFDREGFARKVVVIDPVGYLDNLQLMQSAKLILTDSGGMQKEAYWLGVPCVTLRDETEWVETVEHGWNTLVGDNEEKILNAIRTFRPVRSRPELYGDRKAAARIAALLINDTQNNEYH